jgi:hypothetical protein
MSCIEYDFFTWMFGPGERILVCMVILLAISLASFKLRVGYGLIWCYMSRMSRITCWLFLPQFRFQLVPRNFMRHGTSERPSEILQFKIVQCV